MLSKIIYTATILPIPEGLVTKVNKIFYKFIWGNSEKVQRKIINNDYDKGGLKMVDLDSQFSAIKAAWIPRYLNDCKNLIPWTFLAKLYLHKLGNDNAILKMNVDQTKLLPDLQSLPKFYQDILISFNKSKYIHRPDNENEVLNSIVWGNRFFTYKSGSKTLAINNLNWQQAGLIAVKDFKIVNHKIDQDYIYNKLTNKANIFYEMKIFLLAIKPYLQFIKDNNPLCVSNSWTSIPLYIHKSIPIEINTKKSSFFYRNIVNKSICHPLSENFWKNMFQNETILFDKCYLNRIKFLKDHKLAQFNFKFYHRILPTDKNLCRWKIQDSDKCTFCNNLNDETNLLFTCINIKNIWNKLSNSVIIDSKFRNMNPVLLVFFTHNVHLPLIIGLTNVCYAIYSEWLERKDKGIIRSSYETSICIKNILTYKMRIYCHLKWCEFADTLQDIIDLL